MKDLHQESHEKSKSDLAWNSAKGRGNTDETLRQSQLVAQGELAIKAAEGLKIDVRQIDQHTVSQTIDAMVAADPQLAWLKEAEARGDVDWKLVKETHDAYKYSHSGLGQGAMLAIVIVVTVLTAGSGTAAALGTAAGSAAQGAAVAAGMSATTAATIATAANAAAVAAFSAAVSQSAVSVINNKGNIGAALKDVTSKDSMQSYLVSGLAAGFAAGVLDKTFGVEKADVTKATHGFELGTVSGASKFAGYTFAESGFGAVANTAIKGGSLGDNLAHAAVSSAADVISAGIYNRLGTKLEFSGLPAKMGAHALVGGLISELAGGDFKTGALAAGANEAFVASVGDKIFDNGMHDQLLAMTSQLIGLTVAAAAGGSSKDQAVAGWVASQATKYNSLDHPTAEKLLDELKGCKASGACGRAQVEGIVGRYEKLSADRSKAIQGCESRACVEAIQANTIAMNDPVAQELLGMFRRTVAYDVPGLLQGDPSNVAMPSLGVDKWGGLFVSDKDLIQAKYISEGWLTPAEHGGLEKWDRETEWLNRLAGKQLSVEEKASRLVELTSMAGMGIITGRGTVGGAVGQAGGKPKASTSGDTSKNSNSTGESDRAETGSVTRQNVSGSDPKDGVRDGFSGGKPAVSNDPYNPKAVSDRSKVNRDYYGQENSADDFSAGLPNYSTHSTAKSYQSAAPRDLNEQMLWNRVIENPSAGRDTKLAGDKDFPRSEGWRKMEVSHRLPSGDNITVHYQYNSVTDKAYDMKITTPQQLPPVLQPGRTIE
ncbi:DUF637 domain-containing protein [Pseudomonas sp. REB1044]|uniref:DUF637 domain-containing protein n=1 Tax=Pseudomonas sp. REB1044 TaxID=2675224 RepID=UPI00315D8AD4